MVAELQKLLLIQFAAIIKFVFHHSLLIILDLKLVILVYLIAVGWCGIPFRLDFALELIFMLVQLLLRFNSLFGR